MPRPLKPRWIQAQAAPLHFGPLRPPAGQPGPDPGPLWSGAPVPGPAVALTLDELEALRLGDLEGMTQAQAADQMRVSRPTFGRIITSAHRKVAEALCTGRQIMIAGGVVHHAPPGRGPGPHGRGYGGGRGGHGRGRGGRGGHGHNTA